MNRRPLVATNWKMAMTVAESKRYLHDFCKVAGGLLNQLDVLIFPPYTALWPVERLLQALQGPSGAIQIGAQNIAPTAELARTGEISAALIRDTGCQWVMAGHWEIRRRFEETDADVNQKIHLALAHDLRPFVLVGEAHDSPDSPQAATTRHLQNVLAGCGPEQVARMVFVYEPEAAIGDRAPVPVDQVSTGCRTIRNWLAREYGPDVAQQVRIIYGGSVTPASAALLLTEPDLDGLGASRRGRIPQSFYEIAKLVAQAKSGA